MGMGMREDDDDEGVEGEEPWRVGVWKATKQDSGPIQMWFRQLPAASMVCLARLVEPGAERTTVSRRQDAEREKKCRRICRCRRCV